MSPDIREEFEAQAYEVISSTPEVFAAWIKTESSKLGRLVKEQGIKLD